MEIKTALFFILLFVSSCSHHGNHSKGHEHHHRFEDAEKWAKKFENEKRIKWQMPEKVIRASGIRKTSLIADIGSATGFFPTRLARTASQGRVWGVDIEPNLVNYLNKRSKKENIPNLFSILGTVNNPLIPELVDFIFMVNTYHHISNRVSYFRSLRNSLKKNGKIVIIDFRKGDLPIGPKNKMKLSKSKILGEMNSAGYNLHQEFGFLPYQNFLIFH